MEINHSDFMTRDDGYIVYTLASEYFDEYIYSKIQNDPYALPCIWNQKEAKLYYDYSSYIPLLSYLKKHVFMAKECLEFYIFLLEQWILVSTSRPVYAKLEYVYIHPNKKHFAFLMLPIEKEPYVLVKNQLHDLIYGLMQYTQIQSGYATLGYLFYMLQKEESTLAIIVAGLHELKSEYIPKKSWKSFFIKVQEMEYELKDVENGVVFPRVFKQFEDIDEQEELAATTFLGTNHCYAFHYQGKMISVNKEMFYIGRNQKCDLVIEDSYASKMHACFYMSTMELHDLSSCNGTYVNDDRIDRIQLKDKDQVVIGKSILEFIKG